MAIMDIDTIIQDLNRRFAEPLPEFYRRRIIFWYDEEREFEDKLPEISLPDVKIVALTGSNFFAVKKLITEDEANSNLLVYCPISYAKPEYDWLLNVEMYSEDFRADLNSIWMNEMGLPTSPVIRKQVKAYRKFFSAKERRTKVTALNKNIQTASQMHLAVMAAICNIKDATPGSILRTVIRGGLDKDTNSVYQSLVNYGAQNPFWVMAAQATGYNEGDDNSIERLAIHLLLTAATRTMHSELLAGLDGFISMPHQAYCYDFVFDWLHSEDSTQLYEIARKTEREVRLEQRFEKLAISDIVDTECFPCINECILRKLMTEISDHIIDVESISKTVEKRRTMVWYYKVASYYDGLLQVANMQAFFHEHAAGFHIVEPRKIWKAYTSDYYKMDSYYRAFHLCFSRSLTAGNLALDDLFKHVTEKVDGLYTGWFMSQLAENWTNACADELDEHGCILEIPKQTDFYQSTVKKANARIFVIISDAMRYEVAVSLAEQLMRETQSKVELSSRQAIFPTITKFGMAALLPHKALGIEMRSGKLCVTADGSLTESNYRDKILKSANPNSVALQYKNIVKMKRAERCELVKGKEVVYIYHDTIDEASHTSDSSVFPACDDAINEIKNLVRIIVNEFGGTNILITADHGFLYTYSPLAEDGKLDKTVMGQQDVEYGRRYAIMEDGANPEYMLPVKFMDGKTEYVAFAPRENIRIKMNGGGLNFVHGGISLQEMVVPVIDYRFLRNDYKSYQRNKEKYNTRPVTLSLISGSRKISNMIFSLNFFQKEAVGGIREKASYLLYFTDAGGKQVSDTQRIIADKTSENTGERTFRLSFSLKSLGFNKLDTYYLVIADESGLQAPVREEFQIDIAFAVDEFNFLGE